MGNGWFITFLRYFFFKWTFSLVGFLNPKCGISIGWLIFVCILQVSSAY